MKLFLQHCKNILNEYFLYPSFFDSAVYRVIKMSGLGLLLGFLFAWFLIQAKVLLETKNKTNESYFKTKCKLVLSKIIDSLFNVIKAVPGPAQVCLLFYILTNLWFKKYVYHFEAKHIGVLALTLNSCVSIAIVVLNNIKFLDKGQIEGAYALGMNQKQTFKYVIFGQALTRSRTPILNQFVVNMKDVAFVSMIGFVDILQVARDKIGSGTPNVVQNFLYASIVYLIIILISNYLIKKTEKAQV